MRNRQRTFINTLRATGWLPLLALSICLSLIATSPAGAERQVINNGENMGVVRGKINDNFQELYEQKAPDVDQNGAADNADALQGHTWESPGAIGSTTPAEGQFSIITAQDVKLGAPAPGETGQMVVPENPDYGDSVAGFKAPDNLSGDRIWTLPEEDGAAGYCLATDGNYTLYFARALIPANNLADVADVNATLANLDLGAPVFQEMRRHGTIPISYVEGARNWDKGPGGLYYGGYSHSFSAPLEAVDQHTGTVRLPIPGHGFSEGYHYIVITGTANYDGSYSPLYYGIGADADHLVINQTFKDETFSADAAAYPLSARR